MCGRQGASGMHPRVLNYFILHIMVLDKLILHLDGETDTAVCSEIIAQSNHSVGKQSQAVGLVKGLPPYGCVISSCVWSLVVRLPRV